MRLAEEAALKEASETPADAQTSEDEVTNE